MHKARDMYTVAVSSSELKRLDDKSQRLITVPTVKLTIRRLQLVSVRRKGRFFGKRNFTKSFQDQLGEWGERKITLSASLSAFSLAMMVLGLWKWRIQTRLFNFRLPTCVLHLSYFRRVSVLFKIPHTNHQGSKPQSREIIRSPAKAGWGEGGGRGGGNQTFTCFFLLLFFK